MTNIYITSYGIDTTYNKYMNSHNEIINILKNKKVAVIPNAKLKNQSRNNSLVAIKELQKNNIESNLFDLDEKEIDDLDNYNAIYFSGGEPKYLMDAIYNNNFYHKVNHFINQGNIIIGQSAGAMIMNKTYGDTTTGSFLLQHNGFDFFNKIIIPHYDNLPKEIKTILPKETFNIKDNDNLIKL